MRKILYLLLLLSSPAYADFVTNNTSLPPTKSNITPLPPGADPNKWIQASDYNAVTSALYDVRTALVAGKYHGLASQLTDPLPVNSTNYTWLSSTGAFHFKMSGTDNQIAYGQVTTKGDLLVFNGTTFTVVPVGAPNTVLTADATQTAGVRWLSPTSTYGTIYNNNVALTQRNALNADGTLFVCSDNGVTSRTDCTLGATVTTQSNTQTLTNKTISGASNTFSNIPNAALTNSSITINGTAGQVNVSGSPVALGGTATISLPSVGPGAGTIGGGSSDAINAIVLDAQGRVTGASTQQVQNANTFLGGPTTGAASVPTYRTLVAADIPSLSGIYLPLAGGTMSGPITFSGTQLGTYTLGGTWTLGGSPTIATTISVGTTAAYQIGDNTHLLTSVATTNIIGGSSNTSGHTVPNVVDDTFTLNNATQTLTNKTLTAPVISGSVTGTYTIAGTPTLGASLAVGTTASYSIGDTSHVLVNVATSKVIAGNLNTTGHVVPNLADDTFALLAASQTLTNKTIASPVFSGTSSGTYTIGGTYTLSSPAISGSITGTYTIAGTPTLGASLAVGTTATYSIGDTTHLLVNVATARIIGGSSNTSGHVVPNVADDTFALLAAAQTLTNKTMSGSSNTFSNIPESAVTNLTTDLAARPTFGTLASGQIAYANGTTSITSSSKFTWDDTNALHAIGTTAATHNFQVVQTNSNNDLIRIQNTSSTKYASFVFYDSGSVAQFAFGWGNALVSDTSAQSKINLFTSTNDMIWNRGSNNISMYVKGSNGFVGMGSSTAPSFQLDVTGSIHTTSNLIGDQSSTSQAASSKGACRFNTSNHWECSENNGSYFQMVLATTTTDITWTNAANHSLLMQQAPTDTIGINFTVNSGAPGAVSGSNGKAGGGLNLTAANGANGTAGLTAGPGGAVTITSGSAGTNGGAGGQVAGNIILNPGTSSTTSLTGAVVINGSNNPAGTGPLQLIGNANSIAGTYITFDSTAISGKKFSCGSTGSSSGGGNNKWVVLDVTAGQYRFGVDTTGNFGNLGANGFGGAVNMNNNGTSPPTSIYTKGNWIESDQLATPGQATLTVGGTPGVTTCSYKLVALDKTGHTTLSGIPRSVTTCAATLDATHTVNVQVPASSDLSVYQYQIVRTAGGPNTGLIATVNGAITTNTLDTGISASAFTDAVYNNTGSIKTGGANGNGDMQTGHIVGLGSAPSIVAGSGAGTGPTISVTGTDMRHVISLTTGTGPSTSATVFTLTFNEPYTNAPVEVTCTPANANAAALGTAIPFADPTTYLPASYQMVSNAVALTATTTYKWQCETGW